MLWLSEISHHFRGDSYCYGGGYYRRGHAQHALVFTPENQKITETNLKTVDDSSIDYTLPLAGEYPVSSAVVLCFRTQIFVTRSDVVLVSGIHPVSYTHLDVYKRQHLMVKPVDRIVPDFAAAGASIITFHPEASEHVDRTLQLIKENGCKAGLVFNPATPLSYLDYVMDKLDVILLMSVNPGFGGQSFIPQTLDKLREVRRRIDESGFDIRLEVDGGVKVNNLSLIHI